MVWTSKSPNGLENATGTKWDYFSCQERFIINLTFSDEIKYEIFLNQEIITNSF